MGLALFTTLLLLGSWAVLGAFLKRDRFRRQGNSVVPRATPRILTALALLGFAGVTGLVGVIGESADKVYPAYGALALLALGVGTTVAALRSASPAGGEESPQPRITKRGWAALALLGSAEVVGVLNDRVVDTFNQWQGAAGTLSVVSGTVGLLLLVLGTGGAVWTFLARNPATADTVSKQRRIPPTAWWTVVVLGLAVAALVLANWMLPTPAGLLGLVLLILGTGAGLFGYLSDGRASSPGQPALLRISPRGWVSLVLLILATGVVALGQTGVWTGREAEEATPEKNLAAVRAELARKEAEMRSLSTRPTDGRSWDDLRGSDPGAPAGGEDGSPTVDIANWNWRPGSAGRDDPGADRARRARLEGEVAQLQAKIARLEAESNHAKPVPPPAAPASVDLSTWGSNPRGGRQDASGTDDDHFDPAAPGRKPLRR
jgi:hypothetical protein